MENYDIFHDIAERTGGDIYVGVSGPVRTGKSTFIKKFMELLVLPNIGDSYDLERTQDALPQSAAGRTVMTTEPKFVPDEGVEITIRESITLRVRLVDSVGFPVEGAVGYEEEDGPRMVATPWFDYEIPFEEAAEIGTRRVISEHSTIGLVVTTDGSFGEIPRENFVEAETSVIAEMQGLNKPFVVLLNTTQPYGEDALELAGRLQEEYDAPVLPVDCKNLSVDDIYMIMEQVLYEFPVKEVNVSLPTWVEELETGYWLRSEFENAVTGAVQEIRRLRDVDRAVGELSECELVQEVILRNMDMGSGVATIALTARDDLYFQVLGEITGAEVTGRADLLRLTRDLAYAKVQYDKVAYALREAEETGYGTVLPAVTDMIFEEPELIRRGGQFGVRLCAQAPSLHVIRAEIQTEVTPMIGTEKQSEQLVNYLLEKFEDDPKKIWQSDIFGKPLSDLLREGIEDKLHRMPENVQQKFRETLTRILNEGTGGLICIII